MDAHSGMFEISYKLILFLFPLAFSPGPGNMFFAANGSRFGFYATLPANIGYHVATWVVTVFFGLGFGQFALKLPAFLEVIKYAGSAYVFYLAFSLFQAGTVENTTKAQPASFAIGAVLLFLNPKAYLIIILIFTQFTAVPDRSQTVFVLIIATIFTLNNLLAFSIWAYIGDRLSSLFRQEPEARFLNRFFGTMLAIVALWMLLS